MGSIQDFKALLVMGFIVFHCVDLTLINIYIYIYIYIYTLKLKLKKNNYLNLGVVEALHYLNVCK